MLRAPARVAGFNYNLYFTLKFSYRSSEQS